MAPALPLHRTADRSTCDQRWAALGMIRKFFPVRFNLYRNSGLSGRPKVMDHKQKSMRRAPSIPADFPMRKLLIGLPYTERFKRNLA